MRRKTALYQCLQSKLKQVVNDAANSAQLPNLEDIRTNADLVQILAANSRAAVRRVLVECLGGSKDPGSIRLLLSLSSDRDAEVRYEAIDALGNLLERRRCPPRLFVALRDKNDLVRLETAGALGQIGDRRALRHLWSALEDKSALVRSYVAAAIGQLGSASDLARLKRVMANERSPTAKVGFFDALFSLGDMSSATDGLRRLLQSRNYRVRCAAANTLVGLDVREPEKKRVAASLEAALEAERTVAGREALLRAVKEFGVGTP